MVRSPLLAKCGLAIQRVESPSRDRHAMQNTLSTMIMLDTESGFAPNERQSGIGDVYLYRGPHYEEDTGDLQHFDTIEAAFIWEHTQGSLGGGEFVGGANEEKYKSGLARYRAREEEYPSALKSVTCLPNSTTPVRVVLYLKRSCNVLLDVLQLQVRRRRVAVEIALVVPLRRLRRRVRRRVPAAAAAAAALVRRLARRATSAAALP